MNKKAESQVVSGSLIRTIAWILLFLIALSIVFGFFKLMDVI